MKIAIPTHLLLFASLLFLLPACRDNTCSPEDDQDTIEDYLDDNGLTAQKTDSGLHYIIKRPGVGNQNPGFNSRVKARYTGYFTNGVIFDQSGPTAAEFNLANTIAGWREGIPLVKKDGEIQLFIPSDLAYGTQRVGGVQDSECSVIIFDVVLEDFQ